MEDAAITQSEFYMWRALFAFASVDNAITLEEQALLQSFVRKVSFTREQLSTLKSDLLKPRSVEDLYRQITRYKDKERFCILARAIVWCEGDMIEQEKAILKKLSCFNEDEEEEILQSTRNHPNLYNYYQQYARAGMLGLYKMPPEVRLSA